MIVFTNAVIDSFRQQVSEMGRTPDKRITLAMLDEIVRLQTALAEAEEKLKQPCVHDLLKEYLESSTKEA